MRSEKRIYLIGQLGRGHCFVFRVQLLKGKHFCELTHRWEKNGNAWLPTILLRS